MCELQDVNSACVSGPCRNGATCSLSGSLSNYTCVCPAGYRGTGLGWSDSGLDVTGFEGGGKVSIAQKLVQHA